MEKYPPYQAIFSKMSYGESQMLDKAFYEEEVRRLCLAFEQQVCFPLPKGTKELSLVQKNSALVLLFSIGSPKKRDRKVQFHYESIL